MNEHPLIVSSALHFLIEYIHPFRDGNGRIGRLWQTLLLSRWNPLFAWLPVETVIQRQQLAYYQALQASYETDIDAAPLIGFMLAVIEDSLVSYQEAATRVVQNPIYTDTDDGINGGINEGLADLLDAAIAKALADDASLTAADLASALGKSLRTIERHLAKLKGAGVIRRKGARKDGRWIVVGRSSK
jgi:Fic family protein